MFNFFFLNKSKRPTVLFLECGSLKQSGLPNHSTFLLRKGRTKLHPANHLRADLCGDEKHMPGLKLEQETWLRKEVDVVPVQM